MDHIRENIAAAEKYCENEPNDDAAAEVLDLLIDDLLNVLPIVPY
jgi:hypothetical protein